MKPDYSILQCPITKEGLLKLSSEEVHATLKKYDTSFLQFDNIKEGFTNESRTYFYPIFEDIILLLPVYALYIGNETDQREKMVFDKNRVFEYYNQINYDTKNSLKIYEDSPKWVDFREVSDAYIRNSFTKAKKYLDKGKYLLDIASGPIGLEEYVGLSDNYEVRICADISVNALIQAKYNYQHREGMYLCCDITNIPIKENACDGVLCQHTLYHIPKNEQKTAVHEMYRVTKSQGKVAIVYSLFYNSWLMNISLLPLQLYRIARHFAGKAYVRLFKSKPRLYFFPHSLWWFRRNFKDYNMEIFCWRTVNKYFLNVYIHKWFFGKKILSWLMKVEDKHPKTLAKFGDYPIIVITK
ncbi:MAG: class I SAM-dependent methyltransferase [Bacteroidales bacterium]|nr:class I SAM-dependent methyltransferase [Bacteroidales bacterium]